MLKILMKYPTFRLISSLMRNKQICMFSGAQKNHKADHKHDSGHIIDHSHDGHKIAHSHDDGHKGGHVSPYQEITRDNQPYKIMLRDEKSGYYLDPNQVARRMMRVIAQFDKVKDPQKLTLNSQWYEMGLNELDTVQLLIGIQDQFSIEFPHEVAQKFKDIHDVVQYTSRSFWAE